MNLLMILTDAPHGTERTCNGRRLAMAYRAVCGVA
jgi:sulfur relay (sulfurtransferase) DsrF/TusC family protein